MSLSLYQKYRPQTFSQMVGQEHVRTTLMNEVKNGTVSHAYLFSGPRGVGKTTTARLLARAVNYPETIGEQVVADDAVGRDILDGHSMDVIEIDAASHTGVDNVRENIIESARVTPVQLKRKVFIIDEVHMLSTSAFNALLKTLEEPPQHAMFILATTELHKVPSTIVSRCERFNFRSIGFESMLERLRHLANEEGRRVDEEVFKAIAKRSEGALRDAESLLGQVLSLDGEHITVEMAQLVLPYSDTQELVGLWQELVRKQTAPAITRVNRLLNDGVDLVQFTKDLIEFMRKVLLYRVQESLGPLQFLDLSQQDMQQLTQLAQQVSAMQMTRMIGVIMRALEVSQTATIPQLPLELAIVSITDGGSTAAPTVSTPSASESDAPVTQPNQESGREESSQLESIEEDDGEISYEPLTEEDEANEANDATEKTEAQERVVNQIQEKSVPVPATVEPAVAQVAAQPGQKISLQQVQSRWAEVLEEINKRNHALNVSLKVGQLVSVSDGVLMIGFEYEFYKDRLMDPNNAQIIEQVIEQLFQAKVRLEIVVGKEYNGGSVGEHTNVEQPSEDEVANVWDLVAASNFRPQES